jgi:hypothetical protein
LAEINDRYLIACGTGYNEPDDTCEMLDTQATPLKWKLISTTPLETTKEMAVVGWGTEWMIMSGGLSNT